jgi:hypothetical protein
VALALFQLLLLLPALRVRHACRQLAGQVKGSLVGVL